MAVPTHGLGPFSLIESEGDKSLANLADFERPGGTTPTGLRAGPGVRAAAEHGYKTLRGKYYKALETSVVRYLDKSVGYRDTIDSVCALMRDTFRKAYVQGIRAQGGSSTSSGSDYRLTPEQERWVLSAADEDCRHWESLMADLRYHRTEKEGHLHWVKRVDLYTNTLDSIFDAGRMLALGDLVIIDWIVDHGAEHCEGCLLLEQHSPYTRDNLPSTPRDGATQCLSNCKCKLKVRKVSPSEYAAVEASQTHKLVILELLKATKTRHLGTRRR